MSQSKLAKLAMAAILGATILIGCDSKSDDSASQKDASTPSKPHTDMSNLTAPTPATPSTPAATPQSLPPALPPALTPVPTPAATPAAAIPAATPAVPTATDAITAPAAVPPGPSTPAIAASAAKPNPATQAAQASTPEAQLAQVTQLIASNQLNLADAAIAKLDAMKPSLSPALQTELDAAHTALTAAKAVGTLALPSLLGTPQSK